ncbi:efflux RND transporter periplasmic adaptor subunit [Pelomonas aquatica]|uniref:Efflux RND transporter periplasmic adaptor subunit n=1 Tax=Pelomonas aquatica TaxID=431058 RepID=A0A9X4LIZ8_9BURK|nr:efflux RND transporter periplasmic adaptor subunit [Pelomonas aquatica]MCY4757052.1 efflux RND transporter periplasmic adaptor subunit [Pelomonas aquatica]MDG0864397.1 efflux RND transporter periplasmic adaptor subunit [Pelomonas aquatica]
MTHRPAWRAWRRCLAGAAAAGLLLGAAMAVAGPGLLVRKGDALFVPEGSPLRARIAVDTVRTAGLPHELSVPAVVEADPASSFQVLAPLSGKVVELKVKVGDTVRKGQVLALLQSSDLLQAASDAAKARDQRSLAKKALERARQVQLAGGSAEKDVEAAQSQLTQAQAELDRAEGRLKALGLAPDAEPGHARLVVQAPTSGSVNSLSVGVGSVVNDLTAPLLTMVNLESVYLTALVPEAWLAQIKVGASLQATVNAYPDQPIKAAVQSIASVVEADTRRTRVRTRVPNADGRLRPNMFATVKFAVTQPVQPVVPQSALVMNNDQVLVFVESSPWTFKPRVVLLGSEDGSQVRVRSGLNGGERVVVRGGVLLND